MSATGGAAGTACGSRGGAGRGTGIREAMKGSEQCRAARPRRGGALLPTARRLRTAGRPGLGAGWAGPGQAQAQARRLFFQAPPGGLREGDRVGVVGADGQIVFQAFQGPVIGAAVDFNAVPRGAIADVGKPGDGF